MSLPKIESGIRHELILPSNGSKVLYRPFLVKEEKIILQAINSETDKEMMQAIKNVAENCTFGEIDVDKIPFVDLEWIFLNLRMRSKGEIVEAKYECKNPLPDSENPPGANLVCGHVNSVDIDLEKVEVKRGSKDSNKIVLNEKTSIGMVLKYPTKEFAEKWREKSKDPVVMFDMLIDSIESIYSGDEVFYPADVTKEELDDFIDQMTEDHFKRVKEFFDNLPKLIYKTKITCEKCSYVEDIKLEGIKSFLE